MSTCAHCGKHMGEAEPYVAVALKGHEDKRFCHLNCLEKHISKDGKEVQFALRFGQ